MTPTREEGFDLSKENLSRRDEEMTKIPDDEVKATEGLKKFEEANPKEYLDLEKEGYETEEEIEERRKKTREMYEMMNFNEIDIEYDKRFLKTNEDKRIRDLKFKIIKEDMAKKGFDFDTYYEIWDKKKEEEQQKKKEE